MKTILLVILLSLSASAYSQNLFDVVGPFPAVGSTEEKNDIAVLMSFQNTRTKEQCRKAQLEADANLDSFYGGDLGLLSPNEASFARKKLRWVTVKAGAAILSYKEYYDRQRPYVTHPEIKPCIELENSKSYPSGHATLGRVYGRILAAMFPERSVLFIKRSEEIALNRVIGGVHHPSDIEAGIKLGDTIADDFLSEQ